MGGWRDKIQQVMEHKVVHTGVISTRDQGYGDHMKTSHSTAL